MATTQAPLTLGTVRIDRVQQAAKDWTEGVDLVQSLHRDLGQSLHRDLGQALEKLHTVVYPITEGQDPAQGVLDVHHGLLEAVAFLVESMAMYSAAAPDAEAIARGKA